MKRDLIEKIEQMTKDSYFTICGVSAGLSITILINLLRVLPT